MSSWGFPLYWQLLVLENYLNKLCALVFPLGEFILYTFLLPLIDPEHHGHSWYFTCRAS